MDFICGEGSGVKVRKVGDKYVALIEGIYHEVEVKKVEIKKDGTVVIQEWVTPLQQQ